MKPENVEQVPGLCRPSLAAASQHVVSQRICILEAFASDTRRLFHPILHPHSSLLFSSCVSRTRGGRLEASDVGGWPSRSTTPEAVPQA